MSIDIDVVSANLLEKQESSNRICKTCLIDKQHRTSSKRSHIKIIKIDELMHIDLVDDDQISEIIEENRFVVIIIDDFTDYIFTYLLKIKSEFQEVLRNHLVFMNTKEILVQRIRFDNEEEYAEHNIIELMKKYEVK